MKVFDTYIEYLHPNPNIYMQTQLIITYKYIHQSYPRTICQLYSVYNFYHITNFFHLSKELVKLSHA